MSDKKPYILISAATILVLIFFLLFSFGPSKPLENSLRAMMGSFISFEKESSTEIELESVKKEDRDEEFAGDKSKKKEEEQAKEINSATKEALKEISGIGSAYSERIMESRPFCSTKEIKEVRGIGEKTLQNIKEEGWYVDPPPECVKEEGEEEREEEEKQEEEEGKEEEGKEGIAKEKEGSKKDGVTLTREELEELLELAKKEKESTEKKEDEESLEEKKIDINESDKKDLERISGIGPVYAERIVAERPFCSIKELERVSGIGEKTVNEIKKGKAVIVSCDKEESEEKEKEEEKEDGESPKEEKEVISELENELRKKEEEVEALLSRASRYEKRAKEMEKRSKTLKMERDKCRFKEQVNINEVKKEELKEVKYIGEHTAENIMEFLSKSPIEYMEELEKVEGVGEATIKNIINAGFCAEKKEEEEGKEEEEKKKEEEKKEKESEKEKKELILLGEEGVQATLFRKEDKSKEYRITIGKSGREKIKVIPDSYIYLATKEGFLGKRDTILIKEDKKLELKLRKDPGNLLSNPSFEEWEDEIPKKWRSSHGNISQPEGGGMRIEHSFSYLGGEDDDQSFSHPFEEEGVKYKGELMVKGTGDIRIGIRVPGDDWGVGRYGEWMSVNTEEWKTASFEIEKEINPEKEGEFRIRHAGYGVEGDEKSGEHEGADLVIKEAFLGIKSP